MIRPFRAFAALAVLLAAPAPSLAQMHFSRGNSGPIALCQSAVAATVTGVASETTLATCTIPAGSMGANGQIHVYALFSLTGTNTKTVRINFGGTTFASSAPTASLSVVLIEHLANRNSVTSQVGNASIGTSTSTLTAVTSTKDTASAVALTITGQPTVAGETVTLESYSVILYPKG